MPLIALLPLAAFLEPLAHCENVTSWSLLCRYYFGRCSSELVQLVPLPFSCGRCTCYPDRLHVSVTIPRCYKDVSMSAVSFLGRTARLMNSLPIEGVPLTYGLNGFTSRISRHPSTVSSCWRDFMYALIFLCFFFFVTPCLAMAFEPFVEWIPSKNNNNNNKIHIKSW